MPGRIQQSFIDDLIARVDIVDLIQARVPLKKSGSNYSACCPFHNEKTPSFTVSPDKQFYHCFGCGAHGTAIGFLMEFDHLEFVEAIEELAHRMGLEVVREAGSDDAPREKVDLSPLFDLNQCVNAFFQAQLRSSEASEAVAYLKSRGLSGHTAKQFQIGYALPGWDGLMVAMGTESDTLERLKTLGLLVTKEGGKTYDRFRNRIIFPIRNRRGQVIGFGGRVLGDDKPKYLNSPETPLFHKGREVYGLYESLQANNKLDRFVLVEGYMDVIALHQHGLTQAVAALGTAITREQLELLFRSTSELVMCLDGDAAGQQAAWRALKTALPLLRSGRSMRFLQLPAGEDPDSLIRKEGQAGFESRIEQASPLSDYFFEYLSRQHDLQHMEGLAALSEEAKPLLELLPNGAFASLMQQKLADLTQVEMTPSARSAGRPARRSREKQPAPSPMRRVITLLLHHPELFAQSDFLDLELDERMSGVSLLQSIMQVIESTPDISSAALCERFRGTEHQGVVRKLMAEEFLVPASGVLDELRGSVTRLKEQLQDTILNDLTKRFSAGQLSPEEKAEFLRQLSSRKA